MRRIWRLLPLTAAALVACEGSPSEAPAPAADRAADVAPSTPQPPQPTAAPTARPIPPGPALIATNAGLVRLNEGVFTAIPKSPRGALHLVAGEGGILWLASEKAIWRQEGDGFKLLPTPSRLRNVGGIALGNDGRLWAAGYGGFAVWDGARWEAWAPKVVDPAADGFRAVAVDLKGQIWLASDKRLYVGDGHTFTAQELGEAGANITFFDELRLAPDGTLYASWDSGILRHEEDGSWFPLPIDTTLGGGDSVALGPGGVVYAGQNNGTVETFDGQPGELDPHALGLTTFGVSALAVDASGRVWSASDEGLVILDGGVGTQWPPGSVLELASGVTGLYIEGAGPALPESVGEVTGTLKGKLLVEGAPLADKPVEVCASSKMMFNGTPCEGDVRAVRTRTDAQGRFELKGVPWGSMDFTVQKGDSWVNVLGVPCCYRMKPGEIVDVGDVQLSK